MGLRVHETVLYADDAVRAARFYADVLGLALMDGADAESAGLRLPEGDAVLLIFSPDRAELEGRGVPTHGARGRGHVALRVDAGSLDDWTRRLGDAGVGVEMDRGWDRGGRSVYFRDPAGNSVELVDGEIWAK